MFLWYYRVLRGNPGFASHTLRFMDSPVTRLRKGFSQGFSGYVYDWIFALLEVQSIYMLVALLYQPQFHVLRVTIYLARR